MTDHPRIPLAGVIGSPIAHSRSPALHAYWLKRYGLKGHYVPLDIAQADLRDALRMMPKMGFVGCNVTIPHKQAVQTELPQQNLYGNSRSCRKIRN